MEVGIEPRREGADSGLASFIFDHIRIINKDRNSFLWRVEQGKSGGQHSMLILRIQRTTQGAAQGKIAIQCPWRFAAFSLPAHSHESNGGETFGFKHIGEHTYGARAQRSHRGEQDDIDAIFAQDARGGWSSVKPHGGERVVKLGAHERDMF